MYKTEGNWVLFTFVKHSINCVFLSTTLKHTSTSYGKLRIIKLITSYFYVKKLK